MLPNLKKKSQIKMVLPIAYAEEKVSTGKAMTSYR